MSVLVFQALSTTSGPSEMLIKNVLWGAPGWRSRLSVRLQPGHDLAVREFEPHIRLWADGSEPGACFRFCVSLSLCPSPVHALSLSVPKINKCWKKKFKYFQSRCVWCGAPGCLSQLSIRLQLRSWSHGLWVQAPHQALCWQLRVWSCFGFCAWLSLCPSPVHALSLKNKCKKKKFFFLY